ncbi:hypothetical protein QEN19_001132 [Hanseniaspora menglaensis]
MTSISPLLNTLDGSRTVVIPTQLTNKQHKRRVSITGLINLPNYSTNNFLVKENRIENKRVYYKRQRKALLKKQKIDQEYKDSKRRRSLGQISLQQSYQSNDTNNSNGNDFDRQSIISSLLQQSRNASDLEEDEDNDIRSHVYDEIDGYNDNDYINNGNYDSGDDITNDFEDVEDNLSLTRSISLPSIQERNDLIQSDSEQVGMKWLLSEHSKRYSVNSRTYESIGADAHNQSEDDETGEDEDYDTYSLKIPNYNKFDHHLLTRKTTNKKNEGILSYHDFIKLIQTKQIQHARNLPKAPHVNTTLSKEIRQTLKYSSPLVMTFLLEQVFNIVSSLTVGHLGSKHLSAVAICNITINIILAFFEAICTSYLDVLMPQAYGSGNYAAVGLHLQRSLMFSLFFYIIILCAVLYNVDAIIKFIVPADEYELVGLASSFMKVLIWGTPGFILFENLKRYLQAMGKYEIGLYVLIICFPINILLSYLLVWNETVGIGFLGAAVAIVINFYLMFALILLYIYLYSERRCWNGFTKKAFKNWWDLFKLVLPGIVMLEAEDLSYELLTLIASYLGSDYLAAQSSISIITILFFNISFGVSVVVCNRLSNYIGVKNIHNAAVCVKSSYLIGIGLGFFVFFSLTVFRYPIAKMFTKDEKVISIIVEALPVVGFIEIFDSLNCILNACLRASARQFVGSVINLSFYYLLGIPLALFLSKYMEYNVTGLWLGIGSGMFMICLTTTLYALFPDWEKVLEHFEMLKEVEEEESEDEDDSEIDDEESEEENEDVVNERQPLLSV